MSAKVMGGLCLYSVIMTASTAILAWWLGSSCGIESKIDGDENKVENKIQKGVFNVDFSTLGESGTCEIWESMGFRVFEWMCIVIMMIVFSYWLAKKCTGKKGFIMKWKQRKEKQKMEKKEKMMAELRKQMVNDEVDSVKVEAKEQIPKPKYYGLDALPAI